MKKIVLGSLFLFSITAGFAQAKKAPVKTAAKPVAKTVQSVKAMSAKDSLSYAIGVQVADFYKMQGVESINGDMVKKGFNDVYKNAPTVTPDQANMTIQKKLQEFMNSKSTIVKEESKKFLEANKKRAGVITLPSGLQYEIITAGTGPIPTAQDTVKAHYAGSLINGQEFDNSYKRGEPIEIPVTGVIQGWVEALQLMPVGSKWKLFIPSELGYGDRGAGRDIPGGAALIFDIELVEIVH
ncbi:MAG: FKBP-type peptidyl-prolyl cis-trans isomerase [Ginsengibacter sp.]